MSVSKKKGAYVCSNEEVANSATSFLPYKLPSSILSSFVAIAFHYSNKYGVEVKGDVFFDYVDNCYELLIPWQTVSEVEISNVQHDLSVFTGDKKLVMELHSHHKMTCKPSSTDDIDERRPNIAYGIVGEFKGDFSYSSCFRVFKDEKYTRLNMNDIFSSNTDTEQSRNLDYVYKLLNGKSLDFPQITIEK